MGWFDSSDDANDNSTFQSTSRSSSTQRVCRPDPQDQNFLICKNIVKETTTRNGKTQNDVKEYEERVPITPSNHIAPAHFGNMTQKDYEAHFKQLESQFNQFFNDPAMDLFRGFTGLIFGPMASPSFFQTPEWPQSQQQQKPQQTAHSYSQQPFQNSPRQEFADKQSASDIYDV